MQTVQTTFDELVIAERLGAMLTGEERAKRGIRKSASRYPELLTVSQRVAADLARDRAITAEDVRAEVKVRTGLGEMIDKPFNSIAGAIFRAKGFRLVGYVKARRPDAQSRMTGQWRFEAARSKQ
jgi:hypothetical protein